MASWATGDHDEGVISAVVLEGHLTRGALEKGLAGVSGSRVLVDCRQMVSYDLEARHAFSAWNANQKDRVRCVAVVTPRAAWHMIISTIALVSGQHIRAFDDVEVARRWLSNPR